MQSYVIFLILFLAAINPVKTQSPYQLDVAKESILYGTGLGISLSAALLKSRVEPLSKAKIQELRSRGVWSLDRVAILQSSDRARKWSDYFLKTTPFLPFALLADPKMRKEPGQAGVLYTQVFLLNTGITALTKTLAKRSRPYVYNTTAVFPDEKLYTREARRSFFSGHTSTVSAASFLTAKLYTDLNPDRDINILVWSSASILPALTGFWRVKAGRHFPTDVISGLVVGGLIGILLPEIHKN